MTKSRPVFFNKLRTLIFVMVAALGMASAGCGTSGTGQLFFVSLGDSLSVGTQPDANGVNQTTDKGYADVLFQLLLPAFPNLQLVKLGCLFEPGETTVTMANGGTCDYPEGSQLAAAKAFLQAHKGEILLVTLDIGVNDLLQSGCFDLGVIPPMVDTACVEDFLRNVLPPRLTFIVNELFQEVTGTNTPIIGLNYYNPFVVLYFGVYPLVADQVAAGALAKVKAGCAEHCTMVCAPSPDPPACEAGCNPLCIADPMNQAKIQQAILDMTPQLTVDQIKGIDTLAMGFNFGTLQGVYDLAKFPVADIFDAFMAGDFTLVPFPGSPNPLLQQAPVNALAACQLTFMCSPDPNNPNIHATDAGYQVMGQTVFDLFNSL